MSDERPGEIDACWSRIGIGGDHTCVELARVVHCRNCGVFARAARQVLERPAPADYLAQWAERVAATADAEPAAMLSSVVFRLDGRDLALPTVAFVETVEHRPIHAVPHRRGEVLLGLANIRGELQLCVSLGALLGLPATDETATRPRLAVIEADGGRWAFPVDEMVGVRRVAQADLVPADGAEVAFVNAAFRVDQRRVALLDAELICAAWRRAVA